MKTLTPQEIAHKYVHGNHDALTDNQEKINMAKDIQNYADKYTAQKFKEIVDHAQAIVDMVKDAPVEEDIVLNMPPKSVRKATLVIEDNGQSDQ